MHRSLSADVFIVSATTARNLMTVTTIRSKMKNVGQAAPLKVETAMKQQAMISAEQTEKPKGQHSAELNRLFENPRIAENVQKHKVFEGKMKA